MELNTSELFLIVEPYLNIIVVLPISWFVIGIINRGVKKSLLVFSLSADVNNILQRIVKYILWFGVLLYIVAELELKEILMPIMGASFLVGAAVALAVKNILSDAIAGIFILLDKHFNIGDEIETMNRRGEIINVTLRKSRLRTTDGTIVVLPNGKIDSSGWILHKQKTVADQKKNM
ncbi:MAG: mechanosensitive ion channel family protein [Methanosarcinaceae archaeon]